MEPGWGASGRNNGQVIPTLSRHDPEDIIARHGAAGERFVALVRDSASVLFDLARRYQIQAEQEQTGWVQPVHSDRKSTRLNSSHLGISYAVFCLKKKIQTLH